MLWHVDAANLALQTIVPNILLLQLAQNTFNAAFPIHCSQASANMGAETFSSNEHTTLASHCTTTKLSKHHHASCFCWQMHAPPMRAEMRAYLLLLDLGLLHGLGLNLIWGRSTSPDRKVKPGPNLSQLCPRHLSAGLLKGNCILPEQQLLACCHNNNDLTQPLQHVRYKVIRGTHGQLEHAVCLQKTAAADVFWNVLWNVTLVLVL